MKPEYLLALAVLFMWGCSAWMSYTWNKTFWEAMTIQAIAALAGLASGYVARACVVMLKGV